MLKTVSSITNSIGALNYVGTWNASTNTPTLTSGAGTKGDYYQVSVAGSTSLNGISNWGVGDVAAFNGTTWQRIEGGADLNGVNLSVSGTTNLSGLTASTALALNASKEIVSVTNTGTGSNVLATSPTLVSPALGTPSSGVVTNLTGTASININGTVGATTPNSVSATTFRQLNNANNDSGKYGRKTYITQSSVNNPVVNLATFGGASGQNLMAKVTVYHAAFAGGAISVGYARYGNGGTSTVVAMALEANLGITNVGTLAFSGDVLQYTANRVNNYDWYTIVVEIGGGAAVSNF